MTRAKGVRACVCIYIGLWDFRFSDGIPFILYFKTLCESEGKKKELWDKLFRKIFSRGTNKDILNRNYEVPNKIKYYELFYFNCQTVNKVRS